jgi:hypothetical protein
MKYLLALIVMLTAGLVQAATVSLPNGAVLTLPNGARYTVPAGATLQIPDEVLSVAPTYTPSYQLGYGLDQDTTSWIFYPWWNLPAYGYDSGYYNYYDYHGYYHEYPGNHRASTWNPGRPAPIHPAPIRPAPSHSGGHGGGHGGHR